MYQKENCVLFSWYRMIQVLLFNFGCLLQIILACCSSRGEGGDQRTEAGRTSEEREREESSNPAKWCWTSPPRPSQPLYPSSSASGPASPLALASVTRNRRPREHCSSLAQRPRDNWYIVSEWSDVRDTSVMTSDHGDIDTSQLLPTSFSLKLVDTIHTFNIFYFIASIIYETFMQWIQESK